MRSRLHWIVLLTILLGLALLVLGQDGQLFERLSENASPSLVVNLVLAVVVGASVVVMFRKQFSQALEAALFWLVIGLVLTVGYTYRVELRSVADRVIAELVPGWTAR